MYQVTQAVVYFLVVFPLMRIQACRAVLDSARRVPEIAAALITKQIQRTITEKTVEVLLVRALVTREIFTVPVLKKRVIVFHSVPPPVITL